MAKKQRCSHKDCKKKLKLTDLKCCKCEKRFCSKHRSCVEHDCKCESKNTNVKLENAQFKKIEVI